MALDVTDLRGWGRLAFDATLGLTAVVEGMHAAVSHAPALLGAPPPERTSGITGFVYANVRAVTAALAHGVDAGLGLAATRAPAERAASRRRDVLIAAVNGVLGDHLAATGNPLAIPMTLRREGRPLTLERRALRAAIPHATRRIVVLVHGLCMSDLRWQRSSGHDHGAALARDEGLTPVYLHYNSGLHVSTNGRALSDLLERLVAAWPVPVHELVLLGHSMGGLVARSACHAGVADRRAWVRRLGSAVFLGTPHHGAPLEVGGSWLHAAVGVSPYSAPLARLGRIRSAGLTDLRHGSLLDEDWNGRDRFVPCRARPRVVPLPDGVRCHAVAGTTSRAGRVLGDALVTVDSALGRHRDPGRDLGFPPERTWVARGVNHFGLLGDPAVYERIREWVREPRRPRARSSRAEGPPASSGPAPSRHG